jgi:ElaB/YqjD/DUF883 family membrane-anchored ribosome-binding protein
MSEDNEKITRPMLERLFERLNQLEGNLDSKLDSWRTEIDTKLDSLRSDLDSLRSDMDAKFDQLSFNVDARFMDIRDQLSMMTDEWRELRADQKHMFRRIQNLEKQK